ncbi:MAG: hypothetical protein KAW09_07795, partial [Thermoplasmata archaeon]|nr:hypothetical protein [Thermoplasmata archaeon]
LATFHRLAILMLIVILAYIFTWIFLILVRIAKLKMPTLFLRPRARTRIRMLGFIALFTLAIGLLLGSGVLEAYEYGRIMNSDALPVEILNLAVSITRSAGVLTPLLLIGVFGFVSMRNKTLKEFLIIFVILAIIPTLYLRRYTGFYIPIFIAILAGMGVYYLFKMPKDRRISVAVLIATLVVAFGLTIVLLEYESESVDYMSVEEYDIGLYTRYYMNGTLLANHGLPSSRITAVSGLPSLPIGGATVPMSGPEQLAYGFVDADDITVYQVPLSELTINSDSPFVAPDVPNAELHLWVLHTYKPIREKGLFPEQLLLDYEIHYALEDKRFLGHFYAEKTSYQSDYLLYQVYENRYKIYESPGYIVWMSM